jgi:hypothetical protein
MPIVDVEIVLKRGESLRKEIVIELANELGEIFQSPGGGTWLKIRELPDDRYAENDGTAEGLYPIFVSIIKSRLPDFDEMQKEVESMTGAVAQICGRSSENVHVIYQPEGRGRVAFGGRIVS